MDYQIVNEIKGCFWQGRAKDACEIVEAHLGEIDFDDDDDVEKLIDSVISALKVNDISLLEFLVSKGFDINFKLIKKECLVLKCAQNYIAPELFKELERLGADIYSEASDGDNVLLRCVEKDEKLALFFVENYDLSQLDRCNKFGLTPLMYAAMNNNTELAKVLIEKGSDADAASAGPVGGNSYWINTSGLTPLALALRHGNTEIAQMLLEAGADETKCDDDGYPAVFSLVFYPFRFFNDRRYNDPIYDRKCGMVKLMKNLEVTDKNGYTVLMESLSDIDNRHQRTEAYSNLPISLALIENGANVNVSANNGTTPLHLAAVAIADEAAKALLKAGADINARDNNGNTPLLLACKRSSEKKIRWFLRAGADFNIKNNAGESAAEICAARGFQDALEMMI